MKPLSTFPLLSGVKNLCVKFHWWGKKSRRYHDFLNLGCVGSQHLSTTTTLWIPIHMFLSDSPLKYESNSCNSSLDIQIRSLNLDARIASLLSLTSLLFSAPFSSAAAASSSASLAAASSAAAMAAASSVAAASLSTAASSSTTVVVAATEASVTITCFSSHHHVMFQHSSY